MKRDNTKIFACHNASSYRILFCAKYHVGSTQGLPRNLGHMLWKLGFLHVAASCILRPKTSSEEWSLSVLSLHRQLQQHRVEVQIETKEKEELQRWRPWQLPTTNAGRPRWSCRRATDTSSSTSMSSSNPLHRQGSHRHLQRILPRMPITQVGRRSGRAMLTEWRSTPSGSRPALLG